MSRDPSWNAIPAEILRRAFELQQNGLANCAAARSCVAWREVARNSRVHTLHLRADTDEQELFWHRLLAARHSVDTLKLDRAGRPSTSRLQRSDAVADATMDSIPTACRSLFLSEFATCGLEQYIAKAPTLEQLSVQWNGVQAEQETFHHLPSFATLSHLTELTVNMRNDFYGTSFADLVRSSPSTLQSMMLRGFGSAWEQEQPPAFSVRSLSVLEQHLPTLTRLELSDSTVTIPGDSITSLSNLRSLSLAESEIYVDGELEVTTLTNLTLLDLTGATCYWEDAWVEALDEFSAWPELKVMKAIQCNLFDRRTKMHLDTMREVHLDDRYGLSTLDMLRPTLPLHIDLSHFCLQNRKGCDGCDGTMSIVGVYVSVGDATDFHASGDPEFEVPLDPFLNNLADLCPLTSLDIICRPGVSVSSQALGSKLANLAELSLLQLKIFAADLDLQLLSCLTKLTLEGVDWKRPLQAIKLPSMLQVLRFTGFSLLLDNFPHNLNTLSSLTEVTIVLPSRCRYMESDWVPCIPQMPPTLQQFFFSDAQFEASSTEYNWSVLQGCRDLEWLRLSSDRFSPEHVKRCLHNLQCLYVQDFLYTGVNGSRMPLLDEVPAWCPNPHLAA